MHPPLTKIIRPAAAVALAAIAAGCGSGSSVDSAIQPAPVGTEKVTLPTTTTPAALSKKPIIAPEKGPAPTKLVIRDLVPGTGPAAAAGQMVTVQYVGVLYQNGKQFDASWDTSTTFPFTLGSGQVIPGWDQGLVGMKVGGRRELIIPASLAYKNMARPAGRPPNVAIPPNSPLIFVIDLLAAQ
ncbi:MAG: FKBP-type peptidyl-prolyl cis-trans isomerase [Solirubrobacteraceae bacterium]